jgi:hypothetical protein
MLHINLGFVAVLHQTVATFTLKYIYFFFQREKGGPMGATTGAYQKSG